MTFGEGQIFMGEHMNPSSRVIVVLDFKSAAEALHLAVRLDVAAPIMFTTGAQLFH